MQFDKKYRPRSLASFYGNSEIKKQIKTFKKDTPSLILLCGPPGCGKTTLARIIVKKLKYEEIPFNVSHAGGIDLARHINETMRSASMVGIGKAYVLNEMQGANKQCMNALLENFEEPPKNVVSIICTTEPQHLLEAANSRAAILEVEPLSQEDSISLLKKVCEEEKLSFSDRVLIDIYFAANGAPRKMLIILDAISRADKEDAQKIIDSYGSTGEGSKQAIDFARAIYKKEPFKVVMQKLREVKDPPETIRRVVCNYMSKILLNGRLDKNAVLILEMFIRCNTSIGMPSIVNAAAVIYS